MNKYLKTILCTILFAVLISFPLLYKDIFVHLNSWGFGSYLYYVGISLFRWFSGVGSVFAILFFVFKKYKGKAVGSKVCIFPVIFITLSVILFCSLKLPPNFSVGSSLLKFNPTVWKAEESTVTKNNCSTRVKMLKDLKLNVLPGKTRAEIINLLGEPSSKRRYKGEDLLYYLGWMVKNAGGRNFHGKLYIWLDGDGVYEKCKIN